MTFTIEPLGPDSKKEHISDESQLGFGKHFTDRMLLVEWRPGQGYRSSNNTCRQALLQE
jgi:branched-chain amino acid aminotransferase